MLAAMMLLAGTNLQAQDEDLFGGVGNHRRNARGWADKALLQRTTILTYLMSYRRLTEPAQPVRRHRSDTAMS